MQIETIVVGPYEVNCYVVSAKGNAEAVVIDPGADADDILTFLRGQRLTPVAYLLTHGHADHVSALGKMLTAHAAPVLMHAEDQRWAFSARNQIPPFYPSQDAPPNLRAIADGEELVLAGLKFKVICTPGHTPGGVCFYAAEAKALFCGDTLFQGTVGRTDLPGGDGRVLAQSLKKLTGLPEDTRVFPGHGPGTTIGEERRNNIYFRAPA
jgi:glyoxylase-like metal-dependent hydrolase (beta-lactamase superfamily II)